MFQEIVRGHSFERCRSTSWSFRALVLFTCAPLKCTWVRLYKAVFFGKKSCFSVDVEDEVGEVTNSLNALNKAKDYNSDSIYDCEASCDLTTGIQYKT